MVDSLGSLILYRLMFGHEPVTSEAIERAVNSLLTGIANDAPALEDRASAARHDDHRVEVP